MIWIILVPLQLLVTVFCYLTNWFVVFFADEKGNLPGFLSLWQTWDDSLDVDWFIEQTVPSCFKYDFNKHYKNVQYTTPELAAVGRDRYGVEIIDPNFSFKEKVQRYFCRTLWLYRNCAYGFTFWWFGCQVDNKDLVFITKDYNPPYIDKTFAYDKTKNIFVRPWTYKNGNHLFGNVYLDIYLGWKIPHWAGNETPHRAMIANRIWIATK